MNNHYDIDPTQQDWAESGYYDYDEVFEDAKRVILARDPDATITREQYTHTGRIVLAGGRPDVSDILEAELDLPSLTWIEVESD